jgi:hypothetical protein
VKNGIIIVRNIWLIEGFTEMKKIVAKINEMKK